MFVPQLTPLSKLYWAVKPATAGKVGTVNGWLLQVLVIGGVAGIVGNTTAFTTVGKVQGPAFPAGVLPHAALVTYLRSML